MKKHEASFAYQHKKIPFYFWEHKAANRPTDTIIFLGTGQVGKIPYWVAKAAPPGVIVVEGLPHWHSSPDAEDLLLFTQSYTRHAFEAASKVCGSSKVNVIAQSQAAPGVTWLANYFSKKIIHDVALILPMGLNTQSLGTTAEERYQELKRRSAKTILHPEQLGLRNIYAGAMLAKIILAGMRDGSTKRKYSRGISQDVVSELHSLQKGASHKITLFLGAEDILFPTHEIERALKSASITNVAIVVMPRKSHTSLTTKRSQQLVKQAVETVRKK